MSTPTDQTASPFGSVDEVVDALAEHGYIADRRLATTVFLLTRLEKPLLLEGPAGVGKTELAKMLAVATGRRFLRLQCYEGQDETKALYEWDYGKQLLYTQMLREKIAEIVAGRPRHPVVGGEASRTRTACSSPRTSSPSARCSRPSAPTSPSCC